MKNAFIPAAMLAAMALASCKPDSEEMLMTGSGQLCLNVSGGVETRVSGGSVSADEKKIQNLQVLVFMDDDNSLKGMLESSYCAGFPGTEALNIDASGKCYVPSIQCSAGKKEVWVIANASSDYTSGSGAVANVSALKARREVLASSAKDRLLMVKSVKVSISAASTRTENIMVERLCASVVLDKVVNEMQGAFAAAGAFRISSVFLLNVPGEVRIDNSLASADVADANWYAKLVRAAAGEPQTLLAEDLAAPVAVNAGAANAYNTDHVFYAYPNQCAPSSSASWSRRATMLVVEAKLLAGGEEKTCYYPVTLYKNGKGLESNKRYTVSLTVRHPGSSDPYAPVEFGALSGTVDVADWSGGSSFTETI